MNLITKDIMKTKEYIQFIKMILDLQNKDVSYDKFKNIIINFVTFIVKDYLKRMNLLDNENFNRMTFEIVDLPDNIGGSYSFSKQKIRINSNIIFDIFKGDLKKVAIIFHEINHMKVHAEIIKDVYDINLYRILKENLVREASIDIYELYKEEKQRNFMGYYVSNYDSYSEEVYVEMLALLDLLIVFQSADVQIQNENRKFIYDELKALEVGWNNLNRDFTYVSNNNKYHMYLYDAFDEYFKMNKDWLEDCPLLQIEYYLDENGNIMKRSIEELQELIGKEPDKAKKSFIEDLILERTSGLKQKEDHYFFGDNEIKNNYGKK